MLRRTAVVVLLFAAVPAAVAAPLDPFVGSSPTSSSSAPGARGGDGDTSISGQTGAAGYSVPVAVPPGRNGMEPSLALRYSSSGALRGELAVGWTLELPSIELDRSKLRNGSRYRASLGGTAGTLVPVSEAPLPPNGSIRYRLQMDESFVRVERSICSGGGACRRGWLAMMTDGTRYYFDEDGVAADAGFRWNLTEQVDAHGNTIRYVWEGVAIDGEVRARRLARIEYTSNPAAGMAAHAKVELAYAPQETCPGMVAPIGSTVEYDRTGGGRHYQSPSRLLTITSSVKSGIGSSYRLARRTSLTYDTTSLACNRFGSPLRILTKIDQTGWNDAGFATLAPTITLGYDRMARQLDSTGTSYTGGPPEAGTAAGATVRTMDLDGDGLRDRLSVTATATGCRLSVERGLAGGWFAPSETRSLPGMAWAEDGEDGPGPGEYCTLDRQLSLYDERTDNPLDCVHDGVVTGYRWIDWDRDGDLDLVSNKYYDSYFYRPGHTTPNLAARSSGPVSKVDDDDDPPPCVERPLTAEHVDVLGSSNDVHMLHVHSNLGDRFGTSTLINIGSPLPLPGGGALSLATNNGVAPTELLDLDGDGFMDIVHRFYDDELHGDVWSVYFGDGGHYYDPETPQVTFWEVPAVIKAKPGRGGRYYSDGNGQSEHYRQSSSSSIVDINGDGLPDLVVQSQAHTYVHPGGSTPVPDNALIAFLNTGDGFADEPMLLDASGAIDVNQFDITAKIQTGDSEWTATAGNSGFRRRLLDLDADGFLDLVLFPGTDSNILDHSGSAMVEFGNGDGFIPGVGFESKPFGPALIRGGKLLRNALSSQWKITSELADVDGDGLAEPVEYSTGGFATWRTDSATTGPLRLLTTVDNGRGGVTRFHYTPSTDASRVSLGSGTVGGVRWVVSRIVTSPGNDAAGVAQAAMTTEYSYADPVYASETGLPTDSVGFRGFAVVTTRLPGGGKTVTHYDYARTSTGSSLIDGRGHAVSTETWAWDPVGRYEMVMLEDTSYQTLPTMGAASIATLPTTTVTWTCNANIVEAAICRLATSNAAHSITTWEPHFIGNGVPRLYLATAGQDGTGVTAGASDRRTVTGYQVRYGMAPYASHDYRVLATSAELQRLAGGTWTMAGRSTTSYGSNGKPERVYLATQVGPGAGSPTDPTAAVTSYTYDAAGNLSTTTRPSQQVSGLASTITYDSYGIYPVSVQNELGHLTTSVYDIGSGQRKSWSGPNRANVTCNGAPCGAFEGETLSYDGLGRLLSRRVAMGFAFSRTEVEKVSYDDVSRPNRLTVQKLIDGTTWTTSTSSYDGLGRTVEERTPVTGKPEAVRRYGYDAAGNLVRAEHPDPRVDTGERVAYTWSHDALGRVLSFRRPDGTGVDVVMAGLTNRTRQVTNDESVGTHSTRVYDPRGALLAVREHVAGAHDAVTRYGYDVRDSLASVVDADDNRTEIEYDARGNRSLIRRGSRVWSYLYNADGDLAASTAPVARGASSEEYTTRLTYDAIGRVELRTPARQGKSSAALDALGIGKTVFSYDVGGHAIGRLGSVEIQRWGAGAPAFAASYGYDPRGLKVSESRTMRLLDPQPVSVTSSVTRSYNAMGLLTESTWDDGQKWRYDYDGRGQIRTLSRWADGWQTVSTVDHALNGLARSRVSLGGQRLETTLDILGRASNTRVTVDGIKTPRASIDYVYQGDLNLKSKSGQTGGLVVAGDYSYDGRGRLTFAQGPGDRFGGYEYSPAGNITQLDVSDGTDITELTYAYGARDPQAVDNQRRADGSTLASYSYDLSGNVTRRVVPGGTYDLTWDGQDRLRAVTGPAGRETYLYDHEGNRVAVGEAGGARAWFAEMELKVASNGNIIRRYLHLSDDSGPVARVENGTEVEIQYADALQNLLLALDTDGQVAAAFTYDSFGENLESIGDGDHRRQFNGKENDARTGLRYYGYRYYDPVARRWSSADPLYRFAPDADLSAPQRQNLYTFSLNNPLSYYDPDGRDGLAGTRPKGSAPTPAETDRSAAFSATYVDEKLNDHGGAFTVGATVSGAGVTAGLGASAGELKVMDGLVVKGPSAGASVAASLQGVEWSAGFSAGGVEASTDKYNVGGVCIQGKAGLALAVQVGGKFGTKGAAAKVGAISVEVATEWVGWGGDCNPVPETPATAAALDTLQEPFEQAIENLEAAAELDDLMTGESIDPDLGNAEEEGYVP